MSLEKLISAVDAVSDSQGLAKLTVEFGLTLEDKQNPYDQTRVFSGSVDGRSVRVTHTWRDQSKTYQVLPDINKVILEADEKILATAEYED